jgi:hypothetical protein
MNISCCAGRTRMSRSNRSVPCSNGLGFDERIKGDHHIFTKDGVDEILNLQPKDGKAKPYQVKQVRDVILRYELRIGD